MNTDTSSKLKPKNVATGGVAFLAVIGAALISYIVLRVKKSSAGSTGDSSDGQTSLPEDVTSEPGDNPEYTYPLLNFQYKLKQSAVMINFTSLCAFCTACETGDFGAPAHVMVETDSASDVVPFTFTSTGTPGEYSVVAFGTARMGDCYAGDCTSVSGVFPACFSATDTLSEDARRWLVYSNNGGTTYMIKNKATGRFLTSYDCVACYDFNGAVRYFVGTADGGSNEIYSSGHWILAAY
jgi:hypothetical protein